MFWDKDGENKENSEYKGAVKNSFERVKNDIFFLGNELSSLKSEIFELRHQFVNLTESINALKIEFLTFKYSQNIKNTSDTAISSQKSETPTHIPTQEPEKPSVPVIPSDNPTVPCEIRGLKYPNLDSSIGNGGVPTDRQTNQQTGNSSSGYTVREVMNMLKSSSIKPEKPQVSSPVSVKDQIMQASNILESLDSLKKEIRLKFKGITNQEMLVFTTIFQLEEAYPEGVEYKQIASKLGLSESSIRDYIQKLINKGIPVDKNKVNNKKICLKISQNLKKIASLETLIKLREL